MRKAGIAPVVITTTLWNGGKWNTVTIDQLKADLGLT